MLLLWVAFKSCFSAYESFVISILSLAAWLFTLVSFWWEECNLGEIDQFSFMEFILCPKISLPIPRVMKIHCFLLYDLLFCPSHLGLVIHVENTVHCVKASIFRKFPHGAELLVFFCWKANDEYESTSRFSSIHWSTTLLITIILKPVMKLSSVTLPTFAPSFKIILVVPALLDFHIHL